jgi:hypothetical protein
MNLPQAYVGNYINTTCDTTGNTTYKPTTALWQAHATTTLLLLVRLHLHYGCLQAYYGLSTGVLSVTMKYLETTRV